MSKRAIEEKRRRVVEVIERTSPHIGQLVSMSDEVKLDLILIALAGERITISAEAAP